MRINYGRMSVRDLNPDSQQETLGCEHALVDRASVTLASRPKLDAALMIARPGDEVVVTKLGRRGRSLDHLMDLAGDL